MPVDDPHIHVEAGLPGSSIATRNLLASTFGLVGSLPAEVVTGCGRQVPIATTSADPARVTCLPCREHAGAQHLRLAGQVETLGAMPGSPVHGADAAAAAAHHRDLGRRFSSPPG